MLKGHLGASFLSGPMCAEGMGCGLYGYCKWASRSVLKDFTEGALIISASSLFQNWTARMVKAYWRRRVQHRSL